MNTRGQTLIEVTIASILAMLLMMSSVKVIEITHRETNRFKTQIDNDTTWMTANTHLAHNVRASSYIEVPNAGTLVLRNFDATEKGRYVNNAANNSIDYMVNNGALLTERYRNVRANFSVVPNRQRENKDIEVRIDYARPFANMLNLRCAVNTMPLHSSSWVAIITGYRKFWGDPNPTIYGVKPTIDAKGVANGFIAVGHAKIPMSDEDSDWVPRHSAVYIIKLDRDGKKVWSKALGNRTASGLESISDIIQSVNASGVPDGYVMSGEAGRSVGYGEPMYHQLIMKTDLNGNVLWGWKYPIPGARELCGITLCQSFNKSRVADGFILVGSRPWDYHSEKMSLIKTDLNGRCLWAKLFDIKNGAHINTPQDVQGTVGLDGKPDGYIITGRGVKVAWSQASSWLIKTDLNGTVLWFREFNNRGFGTSCWVRQTFDNAGAMDGYALGGATHSNGKYANIIRTDNDGKKVWETEFASLSYESDGTALYDKLGKLYGYITITDTGTATFLELDGSVRWSQHVGGRESIYPAYDTDGNLDGFVSCYWHESIYKCGRNGDTSDQVTIKIDETGRVAEPLLYTERDLTSIIDAVDVGGPPKKGPTTP